MDTWVYGVVTGYSIQGDDTRLHIQHASGACKVVLREPANVIRVDWLNYVLQPGASVNSTALNAVEILATMNDMSTLCAKVRGSSPTKVSNALSVPFIPEELVTMIKPDTLAVVMVPRQHVLECALNKKGKRGSSMFVAPSGTTTRRSAKRKAASKPTQETRPRSRQKRVIDTPSDDSESEASVLLSSDEERADKLAVQRQNQVLTSRSDQPTLNTDAMEEVRGSSIEDDDPITDFQVVYPRDGGVTALPLRFKFHIDAASLDALNSRYHEMSPISFTLLSSEEFDTQIHRQREQIRVDNNFPRDLSITQWAQEQQTERSYNLPGDSLSFVNDAHSEVSKLVIGIKTAVLTNFPQRQAIRETWARRTDLPPNVKVFFLGCTPDVDSLSDSLEHQRILDAVNLERAVYGDLLTDELECDDKYTLLTEKVSGFFEWLVAEFPRTEVVMVTDDDVYVRVDQLVADLSTTTRHKGLYVGELTDTLHPASLAPIRDPTMAYYTSRQSYPLKHFPPYAGGPHYLVSMDCVQFIAKNRRRLASIGGIEDTSIALWLLAIQVHVQYSPALASLRVRVCQNDFLSFADLSPLGIRSIHENLLHGRDFCHNFDRILWGCTRSASLETIVNQVHHL
ncbi:hypothetical protein PF007_g15529 [Phytophthora fragariae]|uniref:Hexosyltransferase n=2 Tax=Phytophthora fragariae TaxID=53985 RepID=A0A6A3RPH6_9STRA|nr:hypothetical protein PF007_g15529 [Phytophthora fragariae]